MSKKILEPTSAVIIDSGVVGSSVACRLAKMGWTDVVFLERIQFRCNTKSP